MKKFIKIMLVVVLAIAIFLGINCVIFDHNRPNDIWEAAYAQAALQYLADEEAYGVGNTSEGYAVYIEDNITGKTYTAFIGANLIENYLLTGEMAHD